MIHIHVHVQMASVVLRGIEFAILQVLIKELLGI